MLDAKHNTELIRILGTDYEKEKSNQPKYGKDETENLFFAPDFVALPKSVSVLAKVISYCNQNNISVVPRGAGTGRAGGALPVMGGVVVSLEKLNRICEINTQNLTVTVEAGVINLDLQMALADHNLFYPPDPSSWGSSHIGGNIATNAGGPRALKYGVTGHYVLNLEVILPNGEVIWTGANTIKNSSGYNLTQLFVGSEGTLGIVTKAVLRVLPKPPLDWSLSLSFSDLEKASAFVGELLLNRVNATAIELMESEAISITQKKLGLISNLNENQVLIQIEGDTEENLWESVEKIQNSYTAFGEIGEIHLAQTKPEKDRLWRLRRSMSESVIQAGYTIEEDTVVPRDKMPKLIAFSRTLAKSFSSKVVAYGHAGDGNLHIRFNHPEHKTSYNNPFIEEMLTKLFKEVVRLGGTISGEHGLGLIQKKYIPIAQSPSAIALQQRIKKAIDPNGIMNPKKVLPDNKSDYKS